MKNIPSSINLYRGRGVNFFDKFIKWALTGGRMIVVLTEIIALSAFLYRFSLDRKIVDLNDKIKQKQTIAKYLKNEEDKYRSLQNRLLISSAYENSAGENVKLLKEIIELNPKGMTLNSIAFSPEYARIDANFSSVTSLTSLIKTLRNHPKISVVSLDKIENKTSIATIKAIIRVTFKK